MSLIRLLRRPTLPILAALALGALLFLALSGTAPRAAAQVDAAADAPATQRGYILLLEAPAVAEVYAAQRDALDAAQVDPARLAAISRSQLATVQAQQAVVTTALARAGITPLYQVQRVYNGIAVHATPDQLADLEALPGVVAVHPLIPKEPANAVAGATVGAPMLWAGLAAQTRLTGQGVTIAIIDTGIDTLHTTFGGPGTGYGLNDPTRIGDVPGFPSAKIVDGYDFAGDDYNANPASGSYQPIPQPDPDPTDCYGFGHGTHVAATAAGYGVTPDGLTYTGPYTDGLALTPFRVAPGIAPEAQLVALKVFGCGGSSEIVDLAVEWALDPNGDGDLRDAVDIINLSLGSPYGAVFDATALAVENATRAGVIVVASAGNTGDIHLAISSPGIASGAISVAAVNAGLGAGQEVVATFSARGPRRGDAILKPDLSAPGVSLYSAARGTGSFGVSSSGTSMAAPVVAGGLALLRQLHPVADGWRSDELKALAMNTAAAPILDGNQVPYSLLRAGAGRLDLVAAAESALIAYDADRPDLVSISFGLLDVADTFSAVRTARLANKSALPISVTVGYSPLVELPGVTVDVGAGRVLTVPGHGFATVPVTLTVDPAALQRRPDPTRQSDSPFVLAWLDEVGGLLHLTPAAGPVIHLPIHAAPRPAALLSVAPPAPLGDAITATVALSVQGESLLAGQAPTASVALLSVFELQWQSAPIRTTPRGDPVTSRYAQADLQAVGVLGPVVSGDEATLLFGLVAYGPWSTPQEVLFVVEIDVDGDGDADYTLSNRNIGYTGGFNNSDAFVVVLESVGGGLRRVQGPLNALPMTAFDSRPLHSNVMVLPLRLQHLQSDLATPITHFQVRVLTYARDVGADYIETYAVDRTPWLTVDWRHGAGIAAAVNGLPLLTPTPIAAGDTLTLDYRREVFIARGATGLLVVHHHNVGRQRIQLLDLGVTAPTYHHHLPWVLRAARTD